MQNLHKMTNGIIILDFGSQYIQLIARRIREFGVFAEILPYHTPIEKILKKKPQGIVLSGGPSSVLSEDAALLDKKIFEYDVPILGICYGMQLMAHLFGGIVKKGEKGEYGKSEFQLRKEVGLFKNIPLTSMVWMSHFDEVKHLPEEFEVLGSSGAEIAAFMHKTKDLYAVQFHPEVSHTELGIQLLHNFVFTICKAKKNWVIEDFISSQVEKIKEKVGDKKVILGLSGGVDSSVAAVLIHKAIGDQLSCIFVDTGLLRKDEGKKVFDSYGKHFKMNIKMVDARRQFLDKLSEVDEPEEKRKIIGREFIEVFNAEAQTFEDAEFLAQGTIYPDVIESVSVKGMPAIKSHHNVGGLPKDLKFQLLEPLRELFKDEVRKVGVELGIPKEMVYRHPFPGPGLGVRILGAVDEEKVRILQEADAVFIEELYKHELYDSVSQAFVVLLPVKSVGVMGDERTYEYTAVLRSADTIDFMTATWSKLPYEFLEVVSNRIINEVRGINRVAYDISSKPPATIEWE